MASSILTKAGAIYVPGSYVSYTVENNAQSLPLSGVLMLVGEADEGPDYTDETNLQNNAFGPEQLAEVISKYGSGQIVDAFRAATAPLSDPSIQGSFTSAIIVKTNAGTKADADLDGVSPVTTYGTLYAQRAGKGGNQISYLIEENTAEALPTTSSFAWIPNVGAIDWSLRINGGADLVGGTDISAATSPTTFASTAAALTGVTASGGVDRGILTGLVSGGTGSLAVDQNPTELPGTYNVKITLSVAVAWATTPTAGDSMYIPTGSVIAGASDENVGGYMVISATSTTIIAKKLSDANKSGAVPGTVTTPADVAAIDAVAVTDCKCFSPVTITMDAGVPTNANGLGKSMEVGELTNASTDKLSYCLYTLVSSTPTAVTWLSTSAAPAIIAATAEQAIDVTFEKPGSSDEQFTVGGEIAMKIGYDGTTATLTIAEDNNVADKYILTTTVAGGSGAALSIDLDDYATLQQLVDFIDSQTGYSCSVGSAILGFLPPTALDRVSGAGICTEHGAEAGRIKIDAYRFFQGIVDNSILVELNEDADGLPYRADLGLPATTTAAIFLTGGARGATTNANITGGIDELQNVQGNFVVPLFSRDATDDIADGWTDASSTYTIAAIHTAVSAHVTLMSGLKRRRNRQGFLAISGEFDDQKTTAANIGNFRCTMGFQNFKQQDSQGNITEFEPWMGATMAAAGQAAAFYKSILNKVIVTSGITHDSTFNDQSYTQMEQALQSGLLPAQLSDSGGYRWVSDQTTYGTDSNFVFNSIQSIYMADYVSLATAKSTQAAFLGQATSDVTASAAQSYVSNLLDLFWQNKLLVSSDDAPRGYKNVRVTIRGNAMYISAEIKVVSAVKFIVIDFYISQSTQTA